MTPKKNTALTMRVGQIEKNPILALSTGEKNVERFARVAKTYGNVTPAIVGRNEKTYRVLAGQAGLEACALTGIKEMPVIVAEMDGEAEEMKLALLLSTVHEDGNPLSEGAFIEALVTRHGLTPTELARLLKKSKSWISKRQSLASRLSGDVKEMVKDGIICARTAEEVAKLPENTQVAFAGRIVMDGLSKTDAGRLASLYTQEDAGPMLRDAIINSPLAVLDACPAAATARRKEKRGLAERIAGCAGFMIRLAAELKGLLAQFDPRSVDGCESHLNELRAAVTDIKTVLDGITGAVSPGKLQGGGNG